MAVAHPWILAAVGTALALVLLSVIPLPWLGVHECNVATTVSMTEVQVVLVSYYQVNSVSPVVSGPSTIINWAALGFTFLQVSAQFKLTVSLSNGQSATASETKFLPSLPTNTNLGVTDTLTIGYVPAGSYAVTATLTDNGQSVGSGSGSINVGC